ncbi:MULTISPECIES: hypothetical protein [Deinococcus]|jgi:hypothetical protein|uniref:Uncharacterized protein n=2 Tax=Deinococcus TaxID=1298 RepID=A0A221SW59_9DEIO|nr:MULTISPECIES: hypothetical protein [Deinococcus]ASN80870.1 hypothetical protein DFI_07550 [Deinococcus ficus]MDP9762877.1 hypothetical protein [Deinococcus enclensis]GHF77852.1 hypothetical protein GCM10017782_14780 [Deinococcus ficus]
MQAAELLSFLSARGGREFRVTALLLSGRGRKAVRRELGAYHLTVRGEFVQATGPSGQTRQLSAQEFTQVFGAHQFTPPEPTGVLTDLGPLFG